jgi:hypothetical protein
VNLRVVGKGGEALIESMKMMCKPVQRMGSPSYSGIRHAIQRQALPLGMIVEHGAFTP